MKQEYQVLFSRNVNIVIHNYYYYYFRLFFFEKRELVI